MTTNNKQQQQSGFKLIPTLEVYTTRPRGVINIQGLEKSLKTTLALSVEEPIYVLAFEKRTLQTADTEAKKGKTIYSVDLTDWTTGGLVAGNRKSAEDIWAEFTMSFIGAMQHPDIASVVIDPFTIGYDVARLARLGKLSQVPPMFYEHLNSELSTLFWNADTYGKNLIVVNTMGEEWINKAPTGNYKMDGWRHTPQAVQVNIQTWRNPQDNSFHATVMSSGVNAHLNGMDLALMSVPMNLRYFVQCMWNERLAAMEIQRAVDMRQVQQTTTAALSQ